MATVLGTVYLNGCNYQLAYDLLSQNSASNQSSVRLYGILNVTNNYVSWSRGSASVHTSGLQGIGTYYSKGSHVLISRDFTFTHDNNGYFSSYIGASLSTTFVSGDTGGTLTLPQIKRYPTIKTATNFTDEENPSMTFNNYGLFPVRVKIEAGGNGRLITRDISQTATSYTFELTEEERNTLRTLAKNSKTLQTRFTVCAMNGENELSFSSLDKTMTVVNAEPTFTSSLVETDANVINVLGTSTNKIIKNASKIKATIEPTALKGATIKSVEIIHGTSDVVLTASPYEQVLTALTDTFEIIVTDSRGYTANETITKELIDYIPIEISQYSFKRENPTSSNLYLNATIKYKQQTFDSTENTPNIQWKLGADGELQTLSSDDYSIDTTNNEITIYNLKLEDILPYTQQEKLYLLVNDVLTSDTENQLVIVGIPVFDYGEFDLQVNGDLFIADRNRQNPVNVLEKLGEDLITNGSAVKTGRKIDGEDEYVKRISITLGNGTVSSGNLRWEISTGLSNIKQTRNIDAFITTSIGAVLNCNIPRCDGNVVANTTQQAFMNNTTGIIAFETCGYNRAGSEFTANIYFTYN